MFLCTACLNAIFITNALINIARRRDMVSRFCTTVGIRLLKLHLPKTLVVHHIRSGDLARRKRVLRPIVVIGCRNATALLILLPAIRQQSYLFVTIPNDVLIDVVCDVVLVVRRNVVAKREKSQLCMRCLVKGSRSNARSILFGSEALSA